MPGPDGDGMDRRPCGSDRRRSRRDPSVEGTRERGASLGLMLSIPVRSTRDHDVIRTKSGGDIRTCYQTVIQINWKAPLLQARICTVC